MVKTEYLPARDRLKHFASFPDLMHGITGQVYVGDIRLVLSYVEELERTINGMGIDKGSNELEQAKKQIRLLAKELENANELLDQYRSDYIRARF